MRSKTEGPVFTAVARIESPHQLDEIRALPGVRVSDFPLGLQDLFIELLDRPEN
jgi:hypothetical protein